MVGVVLPLVDVVAPVRVIVVLVFPFTTAVVAVGMVPLPLVFSL